MKEKIVFNWSSGKDSALALYKILETGNFDVGFLLTVINSDLQRISMHGVRTELLECQAESIGIPLLKAELPGNSATEDYESIMKSKMIFLKSLGINTCAFGDLFLEDIRAYREKNLRSVSMQGIFPLWKKDTGDLVREFIDLGFKAIVTCVDERSLDKSFAGRTIDTAFLKDLPANTDPCGENGEYHTFVYDGPIFKNAITVTKGEMVYKQFPVNGSEKTSGFWYCDLIKT